MDQRTILRLGHSPDPDDAFMWWPLLEIEGRPPRLASDRFRFEAVPCDIEALNQRAIAGAALAAGAPEAARGAGAAGNASATAMPGGAGEPPAARASASGVAGEEAVPEHDLLEITACSVATYPRIAAAYALTACGSSVGDGYGPKIVARSARPVESLRGTEIAIPGTGTTAFLTTSLLLGPGTFRHRTVPFKQIPARVADGEFEAGVVIHEGQLTFADDGLVLVEDLGRWWRAETGLPLPLGANCVLRALDERHGAGTMREVAQILESSVRYALDHREESIRYALGFADGMSHALADRFIGLYVNRWTLDYGPEGRRAVQVLLGRAADAGLAPRIASPDFVGGAPH